MTESRSKKVALISLFTALAIALNLSPIKIPAPYAPYLIYQIWEIPIVVAFLLYGFATGTVVAMTNTIALLFIFPGMLPTGPFYNFVAILSMFLGIYVSRNLASSTIKAETMRTAIMTIAGASTRVMVMTIVNYSLLRFPPPIGFSMPENLIIGSLPLLGFFNASIAFYTIPVAEVLERIVKHYMKA